MTRRSLCIAVASLCSLLAFSTSAHADCAWVLWVQSTRDSKSEWSIGDAYLNQDACKLGMRERVELFKSTPKLYAVLGESLVVIIGKDGNPIMSVNYSCLPDTVDPRGPKGR